MFDIVEAANGYVPDFLRNPRRYTEKKGNQEPKKGILVLVIGIIIY